MLQKMQPTPQFPELRRVASEICMCMHAVTSSPLGTTCTKQMVSSVSCSSRCVYMLGEEGEGWKQEFWSGKDHCE